MLETLTGIATGSLCALAAAVVNLATSIRYRHGLVSVASLTDISLGSCSVRLSIGTGPARPQRRRSVATTPVPAGIPSSKAQSTTMGAVCRTT